MSYAACSVPAAPVFKTASYEAEMVNQLLFGETMEILSVMPDWYAIASIADGYEGWVSRSQLTEITPELALAPVKLLAADWLNPLRTGNSDMLIPMGSNLLGLDGHAGHFGDFHYQYWKELRDITAMPPDPDELRRLAFLWLHAPYRWGGRTILGVDCSGFTQMVFKMLGILLPRDAWQQAGQGETVDFLAEARCGDLAFFDNAEKKIIHVGILLNEREIIHASGQVRVDPIDNAGIIHSGSGKRTHQLRIIRRYF